jgi:hypothetical protein
MKLREHPGMSYRRIRNWPPEWTSVQQSENDVPSGEIGILKEVLMNDAFNSEVFLIIEHEGRRYVGSLTFEDSWFCSQVYRLFKCHVEHQIKQIGSLELPQA